MSERALEDTLRYVRDRHAFGGPLAGHNEGHGGPP
jgi:alkylation response protein AidB-like acyl-CoA dehydrogenase